jgi:hypothetical protein
MITSSFIARLSVCGVILKGWKLKESFLNALSLLKKNWLMMLEITIILFLLIIITNAFLSFLISNIIYQTLKAVFWSKLLIFLVFGICILFFIFIQTIITVFQWSVWAIVFELMTGKKMVLSSRLYNLFSRK